MEKLANGLLRAKVSFDFDGKLELPSITKYAKELIEKGHDVWLTTTRYGDDEKYKKFFHTTTHVDLTNNDLWELAAEIGIPKEKIHFTDMNDKWPYIKKMGFLWHIDDDWVENRQILNNTKTLAVSSFGNPNWERKCNRIIRNYQKKEVEREIRAKFVKDRD